MGSVVGEKISKSILYAIENKIPLLIISKSGGARMMEGALDDTRPPSLTTDSLYSKAYNASDTDRVAPHPLTTCSRLNGVQCVRHAATHNKSFQNDLQTLCFQASMSIFCVSVALSNTHVTQKHCVSESQCSYFV